MKRDMDLIRDLLLFFESKPEYDGISKYQLDSKDLEELNFDDRTTEEIFYNINKLIEANFLIGQLTFNNPIVSGLTWKGHDFLDSIRDPEIWKKTKEGAKRAGGFSVELLKDLAIGLLKKQIEEYTDIKI